jgi:hypothetical protein
MVHSSITNEVLVTESWCYTHCVWCGKNVTDRFRTIKSRFSVRDSNQVHPDYKCPVFPLGHPARFNTILLSTRPEYKYAPTRWFRWIWFRERDQTSRDWRNWSDGRSLCLNSWPALKPKDMWCYQVMYGVGSVWTPEISVCLFGWLVVWLRTSVMQILWFYGKENDIKNRSEGNKCLTKFCSVTEEWVKSNLVRVNRFITKCSVLRGPNENQAVSLSTIMSTQWHSEILR